MEPGRDPTWYRDAIIYQVHVRAFRDADNDGVGDLRGLTERLDYLQDLGVTAVWLLPFYPSPLRDDGYDIADYTGVHPAYGSLEEVRTLVEEAHRRGLRVITELVCNHTSDQHAWFQRARRAPPGSPERDFYVWSDTNTGYAEARIIFKDFEPSNWSWDPVARAYYWHRFYAHQPDLNFDNPAVQEALFKIVDFWFGMGIDGLRLDAIPYLYEREGTSCENLPETHGFLKRLRAHVDAHHKDRMLLAEANQWPEDAVAYFGQADECHMAFHFPLMPRLFMALHQEDRFPIVDILAQTPAIPDTCQWALFLRNHDELTLEMVTEEERGFMYRAYARDARARINLGIRRRLAPLLNNNRRRIELMYALLLSLPGTPVLYYGDEIGMGDNIWLGDRNGVRTPMQWTPGQNAGFSDANRQRLYLPVVVDPEYHYESINVETQKNNPQSLLWWVRRLIALRRRAKAFGRGSIEFLHPGNFRVLAFIRRVGEDRVLVVANLSRFAQHVELDLSTHRGLVPVEMMGRIKFPPVGDRPYPLALAPHGFYWFSLEVPKGAGMTGTFQKLTEPLELPLPAWPELGGARRTPLDDALLPWLVQRPWWQGRGKQVRAAHIVDALPLGASPPPAGPAVLLVEATYLDADPETYSVPVAFLDEQAGSRLEAEAPEAIIARLRLGGARVFLVDGARDPATCRALAQAALTRGKRRGAVGALQGTPTAEPGPDVPSATEVAADAEQRPRALVERRNSVVLTGGAGRAVLKLLRRVEPGPHPEVELLTALARRPGAHAPRVLGWLGHVTAEGTDGGALVVVSAQVPNEGDGWRHARDALGRTLELVLARADRAAPPPAEGRLIELVDRPPPKVVVEVAGAYLELARLTGKRLAEVHRGLADQLEDPTLAPEPFTPFYQRSLYQSHRNLVSRTVRRARAVVDAAPADAREALTALIAAEQPLLERARPLLVQKIVAPRLRNHGDLDLRQVLRTGVDVMFIDFEGDAARSLDERRLKRTAFRDLGGLIGSYHDAAGAALAQHREQDQPLLAPWARAWARWVSAALLQGYAAEAKDLLPAAQADRLVLLDLHLLDRSLQSLERAIDDRPADVGHAARAVLDLLVDPA